jgi:hypothetical protein
MKDLMREQNIFLENKWTGVMDGAPFPGLFLFTKNLTEVIIVGKFSNV